MMATGGRVGFETVARFNGGLFNDKRGAAAGEVARQGHTRGGESP